MVLACGYDTTCITNTNHMAPSFISPCSRGEADTREFSHVHDMSLQGHSKIINRTVDTDVLVLPVSVLTCLKDQLEEPWIDFGVGKQMKYVPVHLIFKNLGESKQADSYISMDSLDATKCPFYPVLHRNKPGRFEIYLTILLIVILTILYLLLTLNTFHTLF